MQNITLTLQISLQVPDGVIPSVEVLPLPQPKPEVEADEEPQLAVTTVEHIHITDQAPPPEWSGLGRDRWTPLEDEFVKDESYSCNDIAELIGRTPGAVNVRRWKLLKDVGNHKPKLGTRSFARWTPLEEVQVIEAELVTPADYERLGAALERSAEAVRCRELDLIHAGRKVDKKTAAR